jgi:hypothetical protein
LSTRSPSFESSAGSTVSEAIMATPTTIIVATDTDMNVFSPLSSIPASETMTVTRDEYGAAGSRRRGCFPSLKVRERCAPPGDQQRQRQRGEQRRHDRRAELASDPAAAGDALQNADQAGDEGEPEDEASDLVEPGGERPDRGVAGLGGVLAEAGGETGVGGRRCHLQPGRDEQRREHGEDPDRDQRLGALLAPADPDHPATASRIASIALGMRLLPALSPGRVPTCDLNALQRWFPHFETMHLR